MKYLVFLLCILSVICSAYSGSLAADKVVVIPLLGGAVGNATVADVVKGKTFSNKEKKNLEGIRPPAPIGTDYIGVGIHPPEPRFQVNSYNDIEQTGYGVKDLMTGLIWMKSPGSSTSTWSDPRNS